MGGDCCQGQARPGENQERHRPANRKLELAENRSRNYNRIVVEAQKDSRRSGGCRRPSQWRIPPPVAVVDAAAAAAGPIVMG
jgi:hypothetical protein